MCITTNIFVQKLGRYCDFFQFERFVTCLVLCGGCRFMLFEHYHIYRSLDKSA